MGDLTFKDRKLLYLLNENCRLSNTKIGKLIGLSKDGVKYKIDKLFDNGLLVEYFLNFNYEMLGFRSYIVLLRLQKIDSEKQEKIAQKIIKKKHITYCATGFGNWDLLIEIVTNSIINFENYIDKIIKSFGGKLIDYQTFIAIKEYKPYSSIIPDFFGNVKVKYKKQLPRKFKGIKLDKLDIKILNLLTKNARMPLYIIADKCNRSLDVIRYRLKRIEGSGLINSYQVLIDNQKLDYSMNLLFLSVHNLTKEKEDKLARFLKHHRNIRWAYKTVGRQVIVVETLTKSMQQFQDLMTDLKNKFSDVISSYESILEFKKYKDIMMPDLSELG